MLESDVVLDDGVGTDADVVADFVFFTNEDAVPGLKIVANLVARIDDGVGTENGARAEPGWELACGFAARGFAKDDKGADVGVVREMDVGKELGV